MEKFNIIKNYYFLFYLKEKKLFNLLFMNTD